MIDLANNNGHNNLRDGAGVVPTRSLVTGDASRMGSPPENATPKRGAQAGNGNALRHGLRSAKLPAGCKKIEAGAIRLRLDLESEVFECRGSVGVRDAGLIQSALRHERRACLAERWLRTEADTLSITDRLALLREISNATDSRDKCIERLGIVPGSLKSLSDYIDLWN